MIAASDRQAKVISFAPYVVEFAKRILLASKTSIGLLSEDLLEEDGLNLRTETMRVMHAALQPGRHLQETSQAVLMNIIRFFDFETPKISQTSIGLFQWVRRVVSLASTNAIYGPTRNPMQNDEVMEGFWSVDRDFALLGLMVLPRLAVPEADRGRKRLFDAFRDYYSTSGLEEASELIKARYKLNNRHGIPDKEIARFDLGVCTALLVNTIPAVFWTLCHVFSDSKLLAELRQGIEAVVFGQQKLSNEKTPKATTAAIVNIPDIIKTFPLLESVVMEVLRVQSNNASARYLLKDTLIDDGHGAAYILKKDSFLVMPSAVVHKNETAWGSTAKKFDPARFVKSSGYKARSSAFRAFGGGNALCPGRHFAMNEIMSILVIIVLRYDIEPVTQAWKIPGTREHIATSILTPLEDIHLGPLNLYMVAGKRNISTIFRSSFTSDPWVLRIMKYSAGYSQADLAKFYEDGSDGTRLPRPEGALSEQRNIWHALHSLYDQTLMNSRSVSALTTSYLSFFSQQLVEISADEWTEVRVYDFLKKSMSAAATYSVMGSQVIELNPDFIEAFWEYEKFVETLAFGLPTWLNWSAVRARNRFCAMCLKWYQVADSEFDWDNPGPHHEADWEPAFGSQVSRGLAKLAKTFDFSDQTISAVYALFLFGLHANTIPICTWVLMELVKDKDLFQAVREEILLANSNNTIIGCVDNQKVESLPLLKSVYTEILRLHVGVLITRTATQPATVGDYSLAKGSTFQAPTIVAHLDETAWGTPTHPATKFWAYRHVKEVEVTSSTGISPKRLEFSLGGPSGLFFPFGGGKNMCVGRNFAKPEVLLTVATLVTQFEIEFVSWLKPDGTISDRPAADNTGYANAVAAPPDRDMKIRWRRRQSVRG
ncbi:hypothetical protein NUW58_g2470 [Xylaria curta]|uniref:Uncharacterized protein n=1 Tax=Xylaria curta TaxID=42375 RepID=A0ACC1PI68_9PEZI|nr:hypothetical protein NUW58_g2470 [Xylaria curta]